MSDGQEISFFEEGEPVIDGEPGDLKFRVTTAPHLLFTREGNHLHYQMTISLVDALVGYDTTVRRPALGLGFVRMGQPGEWAMNDGQIPDLPGTG
jgi:DnaJ-class molecular chaperone